MNNLFLSFRMNICISILIMQAQWLHQSASFAAVNGLIIDLAGSYRTVTSPGGVRGVSGAELWYLEAQLLATALYVPSGLPIIHFSLTSSVCKHFTVILLCHSYTSP